MSVLMSVILGFIQGVAEFLPISSSGHLSVLQNLFNFGTEMESHLFFDVLLHLGSLIAILISYRKEISGIITDTGNFILKHGDEGRDENGRMKPGLRVLALVIVGTIPMIAIFPVYDFVESFYNKTWFVSLALIVTGFILFFSNRFRGGKKNECNCRFLDALLIGVGQMFAVIPGLSRSGTTITVALSRGCSRDFSTRFAFLLSIPAVLGSFVVTFFKAVKAGIEWKLIPVFLIGMIVSTVVGLIAIRVVRKLVKNGKFSKICYYCWGFGLVSLVLSFIL